VFVDKNAKEVEVLVFVVVVQEAPVLSKKVEEAFGIKHQSPQIIILNGGKVVHSADRNEIDVSKFELK
jgi:bacillithiol system protein YtxJ